MAVPIDVATPTEATPAVQPTLEPALEPNLEPAGPARIAIFAALLSPMVVVLVGFVGGSFDPLTRAVARLATLALLLGLLSSMRRWSVALTSVCLTVYGLGILWVFALPDGRHPTLMAVAVASGVLVAIEPFLDRIEGRDRSVVLPVAAIAAVAAAVWLVAMTPLPLRLKVTTAQATMDAQASRDLRESSGGRAGAPPRPSFDCVGGQVPNLDIGPFSVCRRTVDGGRQVVYDLGKPFLGLGDKTVTGLVYAPGREPRLPDDQACLAPITGAWFEYSRPAGGGACPPGQHRSTS